MTHEASDRELAAFCAAEHPRLVGSLVLYTGERALAEELAQEALARVCRDWPRVRRAQRPGAYAQRIALNLANSHFRRLRVRRRTQPRLEARAAAEDDAARAGDEAVALSVRQAVASLPRRKRTALVLRYYRDLPVADVAEVMGVPENTVKTLTRRALADLHEALEDAADPAAVGAGLASETQGAGR